MLQDKLGLAVRLEITASDVASLTISLLCCSVAQPTAYRVNKGNEFTKSDETIDCWPTAAVVNVAASFGIEVPLAACMMRICKSVARHPRICLQFARVCLPANERWRRWPVRLTTVKAGWKLTRHPTPYRTTSTATTDDQASGCFTVTVRMPGSKACV